MEEDMEYLARLLAEKKQLEMLPAILTATGRLLDNEIERVRSVIFQNEFIDEDLKLPEPEGEMVQLSEKIFVPIKEHPDYNFVGRILGPRGMTAKQLEKKTGCRIMIRGKSSVRDDAKDFPSRVSAGLDHLKEELHVLVQCEDTEARAKVKLEAAVRQVKKLLVPPPMKGIDDLKRKQLTELSILNGTYRPSSLSSSVFSKQSPVSTHRGFPSTPTTHFVYTPPVNTMAYVPPHRRHSQQMQALPPHAYVTSSLPFYHSPPPHVLESPELMDPGIEEVARMLEDLNYHQSYHQQMMSFNGRAPMTDISPPPQYMSMTAPVTPCKQQPPPHQYHTPQKLAGINRRIVDSAQKPEPTLF